MLILGVESATGRVGCAVGGPDGVSACVEATRDRRHAELLEPQIQTACAHGGIALGDLDAVAVDVGPGLYTGLRVGVATAVTMAHALDVPMIAVSSLDLLAYPLRHSRGRVAAVIDARRGEVFHAVFSCGDGLVERLTEPAVSTPEQLRELLVGSEPAAGSRAGSRAAAATLLAGDGAERYGPLFDGLNGLERVDSGLAHPSAASLVQLARAAAARQEFLRPEEVEPMYLRRPDAQPQPRHLAAGKQN